MSNSYDPGFWTKYAETVHFVFKDGEIDHREFHSVIVGVKHYGKNGEVGAYTYGKESPTDKNSINEIENNGSIVLAIDAAFMEGINQEPFTLPENLLPKEKALALKEALLIAYERGRNYCPHSF